MMVSQRPARPALLRTINDRTALELMLDRGPLTRTQLAEWSGLSKPTAGDSLARLVSDGLVSPAGVASGARGPSAQRYGVDPSRTTAAAVHVTPWGVRLELVDAVGERMAAAEQRRVPGTTPATTLLDLIGRCATGVRAIRSLAVAVPGVYDASTDTVRLADRIPEWTQPGLAAGLRQVLDGEVIIENNVNLAAVAERHHGGAREEMGFALLWVGDGLGLALDTQGSLYRGATGSAGEIGYMPCGGPDRGRGRKPADFQDLVGGQAVRSLGREHGLNGRTGAAIVRLALESGATGFLDELAERLALGIAVIVSVADPALVVLSGEIGFAGGAPLAGRVHRLASRISRLRVRVVASTVAGDPVLVGARHLAGARAREHLLAAAAPTTPAGPEDPAQPALTRRSPLEAS